MSRNVKLIDFHAPSWCTPCRKMLPIVEEIAFEFAGRDVAVVKIDADANPQAVREYGVRSVPTFVIEVDGEVAWMASGLQAKKTLVERLEAFLG